MWFDHAFIFVIHVCACVHTHTYTHIHTWSGPPRIMSLFSWTWQWRNQWCPNHSLFLHCEPNSLGQTFAPADIRLETGRTASTHNHPGGDSETCNIITSRWFTSQVGDSETRITTTSSSWSTNCETEIHQQRWVRAHSLRLTDWCHEKCLACCSWVMSGKVHQGLHVAPVMGKVCQGLPVVLEWCQERCVRAYLLIQSDVRKGVSGLTCCSRVMSGKVSGFSCCSRVMSGNVCEDLPVDPVMSWKVCQDLPVVPE